MFFTIILFLLSLLMVVIQDFRERKIFLINLILLFVLGAIIHFYKSISLIVFIYNVLLNLLVVGIVLIIATLYVILKLKKKIGESIGMGDVIFFIILSLSFPSYSFFIIFSFSLLFSLTLFLCLRSILKLKTVPLAGLQALFVILLFLVNYAFGIVNLYAM